MIEIYNRSLKYTDSKKTVINDIESSEVELQNSDEHLVKRCNSYEYSNKSNFSRREFENSQTINVLFSEQ